MPINALIACIKVDYFLFEPSCCLHVGLSIQAVMYGVAEVTEHMAAELTFRLIHAISSLFS